MTWIIIFWGCFLLSLMFIFRGAIVETFAKLSLFFALTLGEALLWFGGVLLLIYFLFNLGMPR
nr:MAG TPA: hypothetical protein [Caudoviricetes sp.]